MPERVTVNQKTQFGLEVTSGTGVAANKQFKSFAVMVAPNETTRNYRMQGVQNDTVNQLATEYTDATVEGWPDYVSDVYLWSSLLGAATVTSIGLASDKWVFSPNAADVDTPKTFTVEHGSSVRAGKFTYGTVTDMGDDWTRKDVKLSGCKMIGQLYQDGITLTSSPSLVTSVPVNPLDRQFYLDPTSGALGTTRLTRVFSYSRSITGKYGPIFPSDRSHTDFTALVNLAPKLTIKLGLMADSNGMALLTSLRAGNATQYLRVQDQGALMPGESNQNYLYQHDIAVAVDKIGELKDDSGVYAYEVDLIAIYDPTWGHTHQLTIQNQLASL